jgi:hypothetical protein
MNTVNARDLTNALKSATKQVRAVPLADRRTASRVTKTTWRYMSTVNVEVDGYRPTPAAMVHLFAGNETLAIGAFDTGPYTTIPATVTAPLDCLLTWEDAATIAQTLNPKRGVFIDTDDKHTIVRQESACPGKFDTMRFTGAVVS